VEELLISLSPQIDIVVCVNGQKKSIITLDSQLVLLPSFPSIEGREKLLEEAKKNEKLNKYLQGKKSHDIKIIYVRERKLINFVI
jgi:hypothetical protein